MLDNDKIPKQIMVNKNQKTIDALTAAGRYLVVILTAFPVLLSLLKARDINAIFGYFQGSDGSLLVTAIVGLATLGWGLYKSYKRGSQVASVAEDHRVPSEVADLK